MKRKSNRAIFANIFGTIGYVFCLFSWAWVGLLYVPLLLKNKQVESFLLPPPSEPVVSYAPTVPSSPLTIMIAVGVTIAILIVTIIVFLRAPITVAKTGKAVTTKAASTALPLITKGHPVSDSKKRVVTARLVKAMKLLLVAVPALLLALLNFFVTPPLAYDIVMLVSSNLALCAVVGFGLQYIAARLFNISAELLV